MLLLLLLLLMIGTAGWAAAQPADTLRVGLEEAIQRSLAASPEVDAAEAEQDFAAARLRFARANRFLTEFEATTAHAPAPGLDNPNDTPDDLVYLDPEVDNEFDKLRVFNRVEVEALQPIYTWGQLGGSIRAARLGVEVEEAAVEEQAATVALRTGELYYNLLLAGALVRLADETGGIIERAQEEIQRLLDEGAEDVDDADLFQVQLTEQEYLRRLVEVEQGLATARTALARQLFLPPGQVVLAEDDVLEPVPFVPAALEDYFALALARRAEVQQAEAGLAARDALVRVARSDYYPKLFLGASFNARYAPDRANPDNPFVSDEFLGGGAEAGLGLRQELNFFQTRAEVEQAEAERAEVRHQLEAARQLVLFEVEEAYRRLITAQAAVEAQDQALTISEEWLLTEQINFDLALGDTENLVRAVQANLMLQAEYADVVRDYNVAVLRLLDAAGVLVQRAESGTLVD